LLVNTLFHNFRVRYMHEVYSEAGTNFNLKHRILVKSDKTKSLNEPNQSKTKKFFLVKKLPF